MKTPYEKQLLNLISESSEMDYHRNREYEKRDEEDAKSVKREFIESVANFHRLGDSIYREANFRELSERMARIVEAAQEITVNEADSWFDQVTVKRHMKQLGEAHKIFEKTASEMQQLQQRLEAAYEDAGRILNTYYKVNEALRDEEF